MDDTKTLSDYGFSSMTAKAQTPAEIGLAFKINDTWEELEKTPYTSPPELPDVLKPGQDAGTAEPATA